MKKKTMGILLMIFLVMIISIGAISAADTNDTLLGEVSDTDDALQVEDSDANIATDSVAFEQEDNATSLESESGGDVEINASDNSDEISDGKVKAVASSNVCNEVLSASNDDVLKADSDCFWYNGEWYEDLRTAMDEIEDSDSKQGTIYVWGGTYTERDVTTDGDIYIHKSCKIDKSVI